MLDNVFGISSLNSHMNLVYHPAFLTNQTAIFYKFQMLHEYFLLCRKLCNFIVYSFHQLMSFSYKRVSQSLILIIIWYSGIYLLTVMMKTIFESYSFSHGIICSFWYSSRNIVSRKIRICFCFIALLLSMILRSLESTYNYLLSFDIRYCTLKR